MRYQWKVWNIHKEWQDMKATSLDAARMELKRYEPYSEEAKIKEVESGEIYNYRTKKTEGYDLDFGPFSSGW